MNVTVAKKDLLHVATRAAGVAEKKSAMPALAMVHVEASSSDRLTLSATDLYQAIVDTCPADVSKPGAIAVGASDLVARVKTMPDGPIVLNTTESALVIKSQGTARKFNLRGMNAGDFPPIPRPDKDAATLSLDAPVLASLIAHTAFAVSTDETRAHVNGLLFEWVSDVLRAVGTDGHRLSKAERKVAGQTSMSLLVPLKAVKAVLDLRRRAVGEKSDELARGLRSNEASPRRDLVEQIAVEVENAFISADLIVHPHKVDRNIVYRDEVVKLIRKHAGTRTNEANEAKCCEPYAAGGWHSTDE